ncbi:hypothetical protein PSTG_04579 [Puccinia striiformis f. sp. tritici PST-78]|uniref:Retrotransposon gag domain-containing protein n=1 Tax=Puccinia striiformis f. sp. tritici PST-78 TaxID=1165861 RepID=A0A0L0VS29_9BASI|nr:hypothetical protein PSTG_04579 [Puccinia striiformis f. sp. tritici PST-78]
MSSDQPTGQPADAGTLNITNNNTLPATPDKSATTDNHLNRFLQIQHTGALQMQDAIRTVLDLQRVDRKAAAKDCRIAAEDCRESARRIAFLEESLLRSTIKAEQDTKPQEPKSDRVDLLKLRFSDGPLYTGPPPKRSSRSSSGFTGISHADDKILVAGGLMKTTALLSFYANEGKKFSGKSWEEFKTRIFDIALPVRWRTTLKTSIRRLKMLPTESFVQHSTRGRTLQSMVNFDATTLWNYSKVLMELPS